MNSQAVHEANNRRNVQTDSQLSNRNSDSSVEQSLENLEKILAFLDIEGFKSIKKSPQLITCRHYHQELSVFSKSDPKKLFCIKCVFIDKILTTTNTKIVFSNEEELKINKLNALYQKFIDFERFCDERIPKKKSIQQIINQTLPQILANKIEIFLKDLQNCQFYTKSLKKVDKIKREINEFKNDILNNYSKILFRMNLGPFDKIVADYFEKFDEFEEVLKNEIDNYPKKLQLIIKKSHLIDYFSNLLSKFLNIEDNFSYQISSPFIVLKQPKIYKNRTHKHVIDRNYQFSTGIQSQNYNDKKSIFANYSKTEHNFPSLTHNNLASILQKSHKFSEFFKGIKPDGLKQELLKIDKEKDIEGKNTSKTCQPQMNTIVSKEKNKKFIANLKNLRVKSDERFPTEESDEVQEKTIFNQEYNDSSKKSRPSMHESSSLKNKSSFKDVHSLSPSSNITFQKQGELLKNNSVISISEKSDKFQGKHFSTVEEKSNFLKTPDFENIKKNTQSNNFLMSKNKLLSTDFIAENTKHNKEDAYNILIPQVSQDLEKKNLIYQKLLKKGFLNSKKNESNGSNNIQNLIYSPQIINNQDVNQQNEHIHQINLPSSQRFAQKDANNLFCLSIENPIFLINKNKTPSEITDLQTKIKSLKKETNDMLQKISINIPKSKQGIDKTHGSLKRSNLNILTAISEDQSLKKDTEKIIDVVQNFLNKKTTLQFGSKQSNVFSDKEEKFGGTVSVSVSKKNLNVETKKMNTFKLKEPTLKNLIRSKLKPNMINFKKLNLNVNNGRGDNFQGGEILSPKEKIGKRLTFEPNLDLIERLIPRLSHGNDVRKSQK